MKATMEAEVLEEVRAGKVVFTTLDATGDDRLVWDKADPKQIQDAIEKFDEYIEKGCAAFLVNEDGQQGEQITRRDWERMDVRQREEILFKEPQEVRIVPNLMAG